MSTTSERTRSSFLRRRSTRATVGVASVAGFTLFGAFPAFAATADECNSGNTVDANLGGTRQDIQDLLTADAAVICLSGTFDVDTTLQFDHPSLTLFGLEDGVLDGGGDTKILDGVGPLDLTVQNLTFSNGSANTDGGAISAANVTVINSVFEGNVVDGGDAGGAIFANTLTVEGSTFSDNNAPLGGAIAAVTVTVEGSSFGLNQAFIGGAIFAYEVATVSTSTFTANSSEGSGGAIIAYVLADVQASTFVANLADDGAAIVSSDVLIENSTFVGNQSEETGGAIGAGSGTIVLSTFVDNTAVDGQSINLFEDADEEPLELLGNIFVGSTSASQLANEAELLFTDLGGNLFSTTSEPSIASVAPSTRFSQSAASVFNGATLASNGGPTQTIALYAGSPAIDAVPPGAPSGVDQRGVARTARSDAGAYEFGAAALAATGTQFEAGWVLGSATALLGAGGLAYGLGRRRIA